MRCGWGSLDVLSFTTTRSEFLCVTLRLPNSSFLSQKTWQHTKNIGSFGSCFWSSHMNRSAGPHMLASVQVARQ